MTQPDADVSRKHTLTQQLVLRATASGRLRRPVHHPPVHHDFAGEELISGQVDLGAIEQTVSVMVPDRHPVDLDLAEDQLNSEHAWTTKAVTPHCSRAGFSGRHRQPAAGSHVSDPQAAPPTGRNNPTRTRQGPK